MSTLENFLEDQISKTGYNQEENFSSQWIVLTKQGKNYLHTFNYLNQEIGGQSYLSLNGLCLSFNEKFTNQNEPVLSLEQKQWLEDNWFERVIEHQFSNEQLEMDFYPKIRGYYIKDKNDNHYMLLSLQKYASEQYTGLKLIQFTRSGFSFPHQENYFR